MRFSIALIFCVCVILSGYEGAFAQTLDPKKAKQLFDRKSYAQALPMYLRLSASDTGNTFYNYCLGVCYINSLAEKFKAVDQLEKAVAGFDEFRNSSPVDVYYALGRAYHLSHRFDEAIEAYEKYKIHVQQDMEEEAISLKERFSLEGQGLTESQFNYTFINSDPVIKMFNKLIAEADDQIRRCNYGKVLVANPMDVIVENLGESVNTEYSEYGPVVSSDEKLLAFTRRDPGTTGGKISPDGDYFEDVYMTIIEKGGLFKKADEDTTSRTGYIDIVSDMQFSKPEKISNKINMEGHEGAIQLSYNGDKLYFYKSATVWTSTKVNGQWTDPVQVAGLEGVLDDKAFEPSMSVSIEEDVIFIVSDRKGGKGGLDIYKSIKQIDGTWGPAVNLEDVNTPFDEDGPYTDPDGSTLYFSSKGHSSMGGYDVFKTQFKGDYWTRPPQNMGTPINSAEDDIFYMMTPRYNRAYYSSSKLGGYGGMDIYRLTFANERNQLAEVKGLVLEGNKLLPAYSRITILDDEYDTEIATQYSDSTSGDYLLLLGHGKTYTMRVETQGFVPYVKKFAIPAQVYYYQFYQEVHHVHIKDKSGNIIGQKVTMHNAMFDIDKAVSPLLRPDMVPQKEILQLKANNLLASYGNYPGAEAKGAGGGLKSSEDSLLERSRVLFTEYEELITEFSKAGPAVDSSLASGQIQDRAIALLTKQEALKRVLRSRDEGQEPQNAADTARERTMDILNLYGDFIKNIAAFSPQTEMPPEESAAYKDLGKTASYSRFIGSGVLDEGVHEYEEVTDVKFFVTQDSLVKLMKEDPVVKEEVMKIVMNRDSARPTLSGDQGLSSGEVAELTPANTTTGETGVSHPASDADVQGFFSDQEIYFFEPKQKGTGIEQLDAYVLPKNLEKGLKKPAETQERELTAGKTVPETNLYTGGDFPGISADDVVLNTVSARSELEPFFNEHDGAAKIIALFEFDANFFPASARQAFEWTAELIRENPGMTFEVRGHTDSKGPMEYNMKLSGRRAQAIVNYFIKDGIAENRFSIVEKGESDPLLPNIKLNGEDDISGMKMNRRVEILIEK